MDHRGIEVITNPDPATLKAMEEQPFIDDFWSTWDKIEPGTEMLINGDTYYRVHDETVYGVSSSLFHVKTGRIHHICELFLKKDGGEQLRSALKKWKPLKYKR